MSLDSLLSSVTKTRWDAARAQDWYATQAWPLGCNFVPSSAINQLEMWQAETFDPELISRELGWLASIGMNSMRVFLHDLVWKQDGKGYLDRIDQCLAISERQGIRTMLVFFDSCWNPYPVAGPQKAPTPGLHNSYWAQSPGIEILNDPAAFAQLEDYVRAVVARFRNDARVLVWDVWNEPDNLNPGHFRVGTLTQEEKGALVLPLLAQVFQWVRAESPSQPVTSGVWAGEWTEDKLAPLYRFQLEASDVISFHRYLPLAETQSTVEPLFRFGRPLLCTEYVARGAGSTFEAILPWYREKKIGAYNWGAVAGKTNTIYPWSSWDQPFTEEPVPWHHDVFRPNGEPYNAGEAEFIRAEATAGKTRN